MLIRGYRFAAVVALGALIAWVAACSPGTRVMTEVCDGMCPCASDVSCGGNTPRCDRNTGNCVVCLPLNDNCPKGQRCLPMKSSFVCASGCLADADCPRPDGGGQLTCCNGVCIGTASDTANCGGCGKACPPAANAALTCAAGKCVLGSCDTGYAD